MNKKFLSAILFGALMVTSTGTFVSCKDYDDDIDRIDSELSGIKSQIAALQTAVDNGKWITGVTPSASGLTITLSDGNSYTVTNGTDGTNGTNGTEWTITEDGYWACNGEKTDVKAVGEKGEQGEAGQQEVKYENGVWKLWNGTEFVELEVEGTSAKTPYCYTDPNDPNYTVLVVYTQTGEETKLRMPMTSDLAQITFVSGTENMTIIYHKYMGTNVWADGTKSLPAQGEYLIIQPSTQLLVQVTPANYDISKLNLKVVNAAGQEAPIELGTPTPYTYNVGQQSRAVSQSGIYAIPYEATDFSDATQTEWKNNFRNKGLSLVANESVRSTYSAKLTLLPANDLTLTGIKFMGDVADLSERDYAYVWPYQISSVNKPDGTTETVYESAENCIYDAILTTADAKSKADSIKYGVVTEGLWAYCDQPCTINFNVHYVDAKGHVKTKANGTTPVSVTFKTGATVVESDEITLTGVEHQAAAKDQFVYVPLTEYFAKFAATEAERAIWNADAKSVDLGATVDNVSGVVATWEHIDANGDLVTDYVTDLVSTIAVQNADKGDAQSSADARAKATQLKLTFAPNYGDKVAFENGTLTVYATVTLNNNAGDDYMKHVIAIPVTIKNPSQETIDKAYTFSADYFDAESRVLTVTSATADLQALQSSSTKAYFYADGDDKATLASGIKWNTTYTINTDPTVYGGVVTLDSNGKANTAYSIKNGKVKFLNREYKISDFSVKFATTIGDSFVTTKDIQIAASEGKVVLKYLTSIDTTKEWQVLRYYGVYNVTDYTGASIAVTSVALTKVMDGDTDITAKNLFTVSLVAADGTEELKNDLVIETITDAFDNTLAKTVTLTLTVNGDREVEVDVTIPGTVQ